MNALNQFVALGTHLMKVTFLDHGDILELINNNIIIKNYKNSIYSINKRGEPDYGSLILLQNL